MFIQHLAGESNTQAKLERKPRRNIQYKDVGMSDLAFQNFHHDRKTEHILKDLSANAVSHQENLEFLEDVVPKTTPYKKIKGVALATQARLRGDLKIAEERAEALQQAPAATNGNGSLVVNGGGTFTVPLRVDDPSQQLEMEMRQATGRDGDVGMSG